PVAKKLDCLTFLYLPSLSTDILTEDWNNYQQQICFRSQRFNLAAAVLTRGDATDARAVFSISQLSRDSAVMLCLTISAICPDRGGLFSKKGLKITQLYR